MAFSPNGRTVAAAFHISNTVKLFDVATGKEVASLPMSSMWDVPLTLAFAPDGSHLAINTDKTVTVWNVLLAAGGKNPVQAAELPALWDDLAGRDPAAAFRAECRLIRLGPDAVKFLRTKVRPVQSAPADQTARLIRALGSTTYGERAKAARELQQLGQSATPALRQALASDPTVEVRRRIEALLAIQIDARCARAVGVLESVGDDSARAFLKELADGLPGTHQTETARVSLDRLARR
jgi:hypothetical protein